MQLEAIDAVREKELDPFVESARDILGALAPETVVAVTNRPQRSSAGVRVSVRRTTSRVTLAMASADAGLATVELDEPVVHTLRLKENIEKLVSHLQLENDVKSLKVTQQRLEQVKNVYEKRHKDLMKKIEMQIAQTSVESSNKTLSTIFRWIGVLMAIAIAAVTSVVTGGASVALIVAAVIALAMAITEEAGGFEAMQKSIAKSLQGKGMSRREAQEKASYIVMGVELAIMLATLALTFGANSAGGVGKAAETAAKTTMKATEIATKLEKNVEVMVEVGKEAQKLAQSAVNVANRAQQAVSTTAKALQGSEKVEVVLSKGVEGAEDAAAAGGFLANETQGSANAAVKLMTVMTYTNAITQIASTTMNLVTSVINFINAKKMLKAELLAADVMDMQAVMEAWDAYLEENMEDLKTMMKTVQNQFMRMEEIVSSRLRTATQIADLIGGMA